MKRARAGLTPRQLDDHARVEAHHHELDVDRRGLVLDVNDAQWPAERGCRERDAVRAGELAGRGRDRVAVRVVGRVLEPRRESVDLGGREPVLESVGAPVPLGLGETGVVREVALPQAVRAQHVQAQLAAGRREADTLGLHLG